MILTCLGFCTCLFGSCDGALSWYLQYSYRCPKALHFTLLISSYPISSHQTLYTKTQKTLNYVWEISPPSELCITYYPNGMIHKANKIIWKLKKVVKKETCYGNLENLSKNCSREQEEYNYRLLKIFFLFKIIIRIFQIFN